MALRLWFHAWRRTSSRDEVAMALVTSRVVGLGSLGVGVSPKVVWQDLVRTVLPQCRSYAISLLR